MNLRNTVFAQLTEVLSGISFASIVAGDGVDTRTSALPSTEHFCTTANAQLRWRESLRDIRAILARQVFVQLEQAAFGVKRFLGNSENAVKI